MLGKSEYVLYQLVGSLFSFISIFESYMSSATLRNYGDALGKKDEAKAIEYYQKSASAGDMYGQAELALAYQFGQGGLK